MENTTEKQEFEFSLVSFLRIFKGKLKMLVAIGLLAAILGGALGALTVTFGKKTYGNTLAFYLPTPEQTGYSTVIPLLESNLFTENILIGNKTVDVTDAEGNTVSVKIPNLPYSSDEEKELASYEVEKIKLSASIKDYKNALKAIPIEINSLKSQLDAASSAYTPLKEEYTRLWTVYSEGLSSNAFEKITALENSTEYVTAKANYNNAQKAYNDKVIEQTTTSEELFKAEKALAESSEKASEIIDTLRAEWRKNPENKKLVEDFQNYVTYSFTKDGSPLPQSTQGVVDTSGKFLYIDVRIPENLELANTVINNILNDIAEFVTTTTTPVEKNDQIECVRISSGDAKDVNKDSLIMKTLTYAIILFVVAEALACVIVFFAHIKKTFFPATDKAEDDLSATAEADADESNEENSDAE